MADHSNMEKGGNRKLPEEEIFGIYIQSLHNKSDEQINIIVRENGKDNINALGPGVKKGSRFPLPWVNNLRDSWKCIVINSNTKSGFEIAVWDNNHGQGYYNPTAAYWLPEGTLIEVSEGWGDYRLVIEEDLSLSLVKI